MYDLHIHILPGIDDGAKAIEDTVEMARVAADHGTKAVLATPHRKDVTENFSVSYVQELMSEVVNRLESEGIGLRMHLGMENHLDLDLPEEFTQGRALRMNQSRYALVELPFFGYPNYAAEVLFALQVQGITPVLAHPERIEAFQNRSDLLAELVGRGMLGQITAGSLVGHFGRRVKRISHRMLKSGLIHIIASDAHFPDGPRSPVMSLGVQEAARIVGQDRAQAMVVETPKAILDDRPVEVEPPRKDENFRRWWRFWAP